MLTFSADPTYDEFTSTDLSPMKLRNVRINVEQKEKFFWPLDEMSGNIISDEIRGEQAYVANPVWLRPLHTQWSLDYEEAIPGGCLVGFDEKRNILYSVSKNFIIEFDVLSKESRKIPYSKGEHLMVTGSQVFFDTISFNGNQFVLPCIPGTGLLV